MFAASGGATYHKLAKLCIRFAKHGCTNRPFYHIVVMEKRKSRNDHIIEQLGTYDPVVNAHGEKLCSLNLERICYWMGRPVCDVSQSCAVLFGLAGLLPVHPTSYMKAWRNRRKQQEEMEAKEEQEKKTEAIP
ncbi:hypothetical protein Pcinc_027366 [Petrolisthes cinctipes]|uniref:Small ribosomal subunit protein bS16m n=1 Tax=Petrolisthes cinctipes TaxID=88211 RepID=A0AAE1KAC7_PETCI|nr:hypothetical protein Pcinc_027366 [Petrolisthes cinctipes]